MNLNFSLPQSQCHHIAKTMGTKLHQLNLSIGLLLYLFDIGSDIYVAIQYWNNNEPFLFVLTVGLIVVPSLIVNAAAIIQNMDKWRFITAILQSSIVVRYIEALLKPDPGNFSRTYFLAILHYIQTITESAPQWCLQVMIMFHQRSFPSYTVVSTVFSLLSLAWSIMTIEKERRKFYEIDFKCINAFGFFIWQLSTFISRLLAIVAFGYVVPFFAIFPLVFHWFALAWSICLIEISAEAGVGKSILLSMVAAFPLLYHSAKTFLPVKRAQLIMDVGYVVLNLATIFTLIAPLALAAENPRVNDLHYRNVIIAIGILCYTISILSLIFGGFRRYWISRNT